MYGIDAFKGRFAFDPALALHVGVERECFIVDSMGTHVPKAVAVLETIQSSGRFHDPARFCYELSACQVEGRTRPSHVSDVIDEIKDLDRVFRDSMRPHGFQPSYDEVGPDDMPLDVYPDPTGRYQDITSSMPLDRLRSAVRIIGTHVHIGMPDHESALRVYNAVVPQTEMLSVLGDGSGGERIRIYREMNPGCTPQPFDCWRQFYLYAAQNGQLDDPRRCWTLIRISLHGTIEFRMFGASASNDRVAGWARTCHDLCAAAL